MIDVISTRCVVLARHGVAFVDIDVTNVALETWSAVANEAGVDVTGNDVRAVGGVVETWIDTAAIKLITQSLCKRYLIQSIKKLFIT